jgi:L-ascorbate metabolism protein UlaG (beta-lactamase superfamily)
MIRPVLSGEALVRQIRESRPPPGAVDLWWLGQSGYCIKSDRATIYVDLYLSEHLTAKYAGTNKEHIRMTESPLRGRDVVGAGLILASHKHSDHLDPGTMPEAMTASPAAALLLPAAIADYARDSLKLPAGRFLPADAGQTFERAGVTVEVIASAHEEFERDAAGRHPYLGFLITIGGVRLYHSGDTILYPGLTAKLARRRLDVAFLPINGRDERRRALGVAGNMTFEEVAQTCREARPRVVVPHHYDMFTFNTASAEEFVEFLGSHAPEQAVNVLQCGAVRRITASG